MGLKDRLAGIVKKFGGKRIAVIGDLALDQYSYGKVEKLNPEMPGAFLLNVRGDEYRLGCAGNVAHNVAALGANTSLYGLLGNDYAGKELRKLCENDKISLNSGYEGDTIIKQRIVVKEGKHIVNLGRVDRGEVGLEPVSLEGRRFFLQKLKKDKPGMIILSDYNKRMFKTQLAQDIIDYAGRQRIPVIAAPKPENMTKFYGAKLLCLNLKEAHATVKTKGDYKELAKELKKMTNSEYIVITCGEDGMVSYDGKYHEFPTRAREVVDVTGAGDTAVSALALSLLCNLSISYASQIANYAAGIVVEKSGTAATSIDELVERIRSSD
jgi:rfaE bifunctional protein kinase chain/domain